MMNTRFWKIGLAVALAWTPVAMPAAQQKPATQMEVGNGPRKHVVQKGETLYAISRKYAVSVEEIQKWNNLEGASLSIGQELIVSSPEQTAEKLAEKVVSAAAPPEIDKNADVHVVKPGETLYAISRMYDVPVGDIKKLNRLADGNISIGQRLILRSDGVTTVATSEKPPKAEKAPKEAKEANPNQGVELITMIKDTVEEDPVDETAVEMEVLKVEESVKLDPGAKLEDYTDKASGKKYQRVTENGKAGKIEDFSTDQTKFYAFHKYLPAGSYIRVDFPDRSQSILCEVRSQLDKNDSHVVRLTAKCMEYLRMEGGEGEVVLRYVVPK